MIPGGSGIPADAVIPADAIAQRFGLAGPATLVGPVDRGYQGRIWRLDCADGCFAVKETLAPLDREQIALAYAFQFQAERHGVRAPRQLVTVDGEPAAYENGQTLRVFAWVELAEASRALDAAGVGRTLAALHRGGLEMSANVSASVAGQPAEVPTSVVVHPGDADRLATVHPWYVEPVGRDRWVELIAELRLTGAPFADELNSLLPALVDSESIMDPAGELTWCHRDLWADNVRAGPDGGPVVIDWDNCGAASATGELAMLLVEFGTTAERAGALHTAYRRAGGPARVTEPADFTMPIAVLHHLVELGARQWLAAGGALSRQRASERVHEFTRDPFTLADARRLVRAVAE